MASSFLAGIFLRERQGLSDIRLHRAKKLLGADSAVDRVSSYASTGQTGNNNATAASVQPDFRVVARDEGEPATLAEVPLHFARDPRLCSL